ncbi:MAG: citrate synthase [Chloroflexi bacterium]|jgi:citrate synthase|nr:citrate synthase [Chloroflexota bacterium]
MPSATAGLRDVIAATSAICNVNGSEGKLSYFGYDIADLAEHSTFEEVIYLLWHGELPTCAQLDELSQSIKSESELPGEILALLASFPHTGSPMTALRTAVSALAMYDPEAADMSRPANVRKAIRLTARIPSIVAAFDRLRNGHATVGPRRDLSLAANFLYMLSGVEADPGNARVLDVALILHADHELNASTFAAREVASTLADMYGAITAAIATLAGPSHGGANEKVMRMLEAIGTPEKAQEWITTALERGDRIMGFGHAVYRAEDPRATVLRNLSREIGQRTGDLRWFEMSQRVERVVTETKHLYANVDFYSASAYRALGIPTELFTPIFACSRIAGWSAHVLEQYDNNRLMRPRAEYIGPKSRSYTPIGQR